MKGKSKCKILKDIRRKIAEENDIEFVTSECKHKGDCSGTCPKCEAEVKYLEDELKKRSSAGKKIAVAGIAAAMVVSAGGCDLIDNSSTLGDIDLSQQETTAATGEEAIMGKMIDDITDESVTDEETTADESKLTTETEGDPDTTATECTEEIAGEIAYFEETDE